jgi:hypothetical protein
MYIEFVLPTGAGGLGAQHAAYEIKKQLFDWSNKYQLPYKIKIVKYTLRVILESAETYNFFALTFESQRRWYFVEPMSTPNSIDKQD